MKRSIVAALVALACAGVALGAADVVPKYSGPSGQGQVIWWAPVTGTTNLVMTTNGISKITVPVGVLTNALTISRGEVTASSAVSAQTVAVTGAGTNLLQAPTITVTPQTVAVTGDGTNLLQAPTITVTPQTTTGYDSTGAAITNAAGATIAIVTNVLVTIAETFATNQVVTVSLQNAGAVMTNAAVAIAETFATNASVTVTLANASKLMTNAVVTTTITPSGSAVVTNITTTISGN